MQYLLKKKTSDKNLFSIPLYCVDDKILSVKNKKIFQTMKSFRCVSWNYTLLLVLIIHVPKWRMTLPRSLTSMNFPSAAIDVNDSAIAFWRSFSTSETCYKHNIICIRRRPDLCTGCYGRNLKLNVIRIVNADDKVKRVRVCYLAHVKKNVLKMQI